MHIQLSHRKIDEKYKKQLFTFGAILQMFAK